MSNTSQNEGLSQKQKAFIITAIVLIVVILVGVAGYFYLQKKRNDRSDESQNLILTADGFSLQKTEDGYAVYRYTGSERDVTVPQTYDGKPITAILSLAFSDNTALFSVTLPASVSEVEKEAFAGCLNLSVVYCERDDIFKTGWNKGTTAALSVAHRTHSFEVCAVSARYLARPGDCRHYAVYYKSCLCGEKGSETFEDTKSGYGEHKNVRDVEPCAATCTENGFSAGKYCDDCKRFVSGGEITENALGHTYEKLTITEPYVCANGETILPGRKASCSENEENVWKCVRCDALYREEGEPKHGHTVDEWEKTGEEKKSGGTACETVVKYSGVCKECKAVVETSETVVMHDFYTVITKEADCSQSGEKKTFCKNDGCRFYDVAYKTISFDVPSGVDGHLWQIDSKKGSLVEYSCEHCSATKKAFCSEDSSATIDSVADVEEIALSTASISLDDGIKSGLSGKNVSVSATVADNDAVSQAKNSLTAEERKLLGTRDVYSFTMRVAGDSVSDLGGEATIRIPYRIEPGESVDKVVVWYFAENGTLEKIDAFYSETDGKGYATFATTHFSLYTATGLSNEDYCACYGHDEENLFVQEATCFENGYTLCLRCGKQTAVSERLEHVFVVRTKKEATCSKEGIALHVCALCGATYESGIPAVGHDYHVAEKTEPTCTAEGEILYRCKLCGDEYETVSTRKEHTFQTVSVERTCVSDGYTVKTCLVCNAVFYSDFSEKAEHRFGEEWICRGDGHSRACIVCGAQGSKEAHVLSRATATEQEDVHCTVCGYVVSSPIGHEHASVRKITKQAPTCTRDGNTDYYVCSCGKKFFDSECANEILNADATVLKATGHSPQRKEGKEPTCTEKGYTESSVCAACGTVLKASVSLDEKGHAYRGTVVPPTCTDGGYTEFTCDVCKDTYRSEVVEPAGHRYIAEVTMPTCTEKGYTTYTCRVCKDSYVGDEKEAVGHSYKREWSVSSEQHWHVCTRCGQSGEKSAHIPDREKATEERGVFCSVCGFETEKAVVHVCAAAEKVCYKEADCEHSGNREYYVCRCGKWYSDAACKEEITDKSVVLTAPVGHDTSETAAVSATCTEAGYTAGLYCKNCGQYISGHEVTEPIGHAYGEVRRFDENGHWSECVRCGDKTNTESHDDLAVWQKTEEGHFHACSLCGYRTETVAHSPDRTEPTETDDVACSVCGYIIAVKLNHIHRFEYVSDGTFHWRACGCGETEEKEVCRGGEATCREKAVCEICGNKYGQLDEHKGDGILHFDKESHYELCTVCFEKTNETQHNLAKTVKEATCTEPGYSLRSCTVCEYVGEKYDETSELGHLFEHYVSDGDATCFADGTERSRCARCEKTDVRAEQNSRLSHTASSAVIENSRYATCEEDGSYDEVVYCSACGTELERTNKKIEKLGHRLGEEWEADEEGHFRTCERCSEKVGFETHTPDIEAPTEEDCQTCTVCGYIMQERVPHTHVFDRKAVEERYLAQAAGCNSHANYFYSCACGEKGTELFVDEESPFAPHSLVCEVYSGYIKTQATCRDHATYWKHCYNCNYVSDTEYFVDDKSDLAEHTPSNAVRENQTDATCMQAGAFDEVVYCAVCGEELSRINRAIAATGHTQSETWYMTETAHYHLCTICGEKLSEESHVPDFDRPTEEHGVTCLICGYEIEKASEHVHVYNRKIKDGYFASEATCVTKSTYYFSCACGERGAETFEDEDGEYAEHVFEEVIHGDYRKSDATCISYAVYYKSCKNCNAVSEETFEDMQSGYGEHVKSAAEKLVITEATCTEDGAYDLVCTCVVCHVEMERTPMVEQKKGHAYDEIGYEWSDDGLSCTAYAVCSRDGSHILNESASVSLTTRTEPNCTQDGTAVYEASFISEEFVGQTKIVKLPAWGHGESGEWKSDETGHYRECCECGAKLTVYAHTPDYEFATEDHGVHCTVCGYEITGKAEHVHIFDREAAEPSYLVLPATCTTHAVYYYSCSCGACGTETFETDSFAEHVWAYRHIDNTETHEKYCTVCTESTTENCCFSDDVCTECGGGKQQTQPVADTMPRTVSLYSAAFGYIADVTNLIFGYNDYLEIDLTPYMIFGEVYTAAMSDNNIADVSLNGFILVVGYFEAESLIVILM